MKRVLLVSTILAVTASANAAEHAITPGQGSLTDAAGNTWEITPSGSIKEGETYTPGGGGTAAVAIVNGVVYGEDSSGKGWFTLSGDGQYWSNSSPPPAVDVAAIPSPAQPTAPVASPPSEPTTTAAAVPTSDQQQTQPAAPVVCGTQAAGGGFKTIGGQIIGPDGKVFIARGINAADRDMDTVAAKLPTLMPGVNFIRLAIYSYQSPDAYGGFISQMTAQGRVVEIEHHVETDGSTGGGGRGDIASGGWLADETAFYAQMAAAYKNNPYVWFGTTNEPPSKPGLSQWQQTTVNAIRGTGNNNPIMLEPWGSRASGHGGADLQSGMDASVYASMHNTIWDPHIYGYQTDGSTDPGTNEANVMAMATAAQTIPSADGAMPVIIGEYGPSTSGSSMDGNGNQTTEAVINATGTGKYGSAAWHWGQQDCCNNLGDSSGTSLTAYGTQVSLLGNTSVVPCSQTELTHIAQQAISAAQVSVQGQ